MPSRSERKGITSHDRVPTALHLLVVHCGAGEFRTLRIGSAYGDSAALAVSGDDYATSEGNFAVLRVGKRQSMVVDHFVRPSV